MIKKSLIALALGTAAFAATPASATFSWWGSSSGGSHTHGPGCGHYTGSSSTGSSTSTSTSTSTSSTSGGSTTTGGTNTSTSSGTKVPEPGMLGMFGLGLAGIALGRRRRRNAR